MLLRSPQRTTKWHHAVLGLETKVTLFVLLGNGKRWLLEKRTRNAWEKRAGLAFGQGKNTVDKEEMYCSCMSLKLY